MKIGIHPQYYDEAKIKCACGNNWTVGATMPEISIEICNKCHPFYSGKEKFLDVSGRIEKIKKRMAKSEEKMKKSGKTKKPTAAHPTKKSKSKK